jgi:DNA-directed RNA polymerase subunit alpha
MEVTAADATMDAAAVVEQTFTKDSWTRQDCERLCAALFTMDNGADKFRAFAGRLFAESPDPTGAAAVKIGIVQYLLGDFEQAAKTLGASTDNRDRRWYQGLCYRRLNRYDRAVEEFARAADRGWDENQAKVAIAQCQCLARDLDAAAKAVDDLAGCADLSTYHVLRGMVQEAQGDYEQAEEAYGEALEIDPTSSEAMFRLAFLYDMHGEEDQAMDLYEQCLQVPPIDVSAAVNLAVLYEDQSEWDRADACLHLVLSAQPNHSRARLFARDVTGSRSMYYDEDLERRTVQRNAVLDIPVTDFELSVRARNCLKKMEIYTLGDLLRVTEAELLGSKNFGETSLIEIKTMLAQKGLQLGQEVDPGPSRAMMPMQAEGVDADENALLSKPVGELELSVRARRALDRLGILTLGDLAARSESELLTCKNFGQTSLNEVKQRLAEHGVGLRGR